MGRCSCGCASIDFLHSAQGQKARIVADADATAASGEYVGVLIWAIDDQLSGLEFYSYSDTPAQLPALTSISAHENVRAGDAA